MELSLRLPILPSQCYSPLADYTLEHNHGHTAARQPLRESTGNAQHDRLGALVRPYSHRPTPLSTVAQPMPTPLIVPSQALHPAYGSPASMKSHRYHQLRSLKRRRPDVNPFWLYWQQFQTSRKKQGEKDNESGQKWPQVLEDAFLDGKI